MPRECSFSIRRVHPAPHDSNRLAPIFDKSIVPARQFSPKSSVATTATSVLSPCSSYRTIPGRIPRKTRARAQLIYILAAAPLSRARALCSPLQRERPDAHVVRGRARQRVDVHVRIRIPYPEEERRAHRGVALLPSAEERLIRNTTTRCPSGCLFFSLVCFSHLLLASGRARDLSAREGRVCVACVFRGCCDSDVCLLPFGAGGVDMVFLVRAGVGKGGGLSLKIEEDMMDV